MDEGRLGAVRRRTNHNRKNVIVMNDIIKNRQEVYQNYLSKEQHGMESKIEAGELGLKRNIVRNNILMQCLEARKEKMVSKNPALPLGKYGGRPIHTFSRDIESMIAWMHPRLRRLRKVEHMKQNGLRLGAIIDPTTVPGRIDAVFGPCGERSNSDSHLLSGTQTSSRKRSVSRRRLSKTGGLLDPLTRRQPLSRRRIEAPPMMKAFQTSSRENTSERHGDVPTNQSSNKGTRSTPVEPCHEMLRSERKNSIHLDNPGEKGFPKKPSNSLIPLIRVNSTQDNPNDKVGQRRSVNSNNNNNNNNNSTELKRHASKGKSLMQAEVKNGTSVPILEVDAPPNRAWRPTLTLPPIRTTRELVKK